MRSILLLLVFIILPICAAAQGPIGDTIDCTDIRIDYIDDPNLTREERLILMDKALIEAINKFEHCQQQRAMEAAADSSNSENTGSGKNAGSSVQGTEGDGNIEQETAGETGDAGAAISGGMKSAASSSMTGTEPDPSETDTPVVATEDSQAGETVGTQKTTGSESQGSEVGAKSKGGVKTDFGVAAKNRQTPDDIPDAKNDDALAAQIRYAAENEKDPEKRKQLWNEYRKYKGLPKK